MTRTIELLNLYLNNIRGNNPYKLVLKGGTALAVHHLKGHRESEDLVTSYKNAFRNIDMHFKGLKESQVKGFVERTVMQLRRFRNDLLRQ